ncbi:MAG: type 4a pilus biogenesis protein PilO [Capsulimonadales bacterium]|nr:type 4a pilus biogenesis protein PilO [Capsulimonadales bacterium]
MFDFKNKEQQLPSLLSAVAICLLAATFLYMILVPPPNVAGIAKGRVRSRQQLETEIARAKERSAAAEATIRKRLRTGDPNTVLAGALAQLNERTRKYKLTMAAFRPQRPRVLDQVTELPWTVQVSGPYPSVVAFLAATDRTETRMVLRTAQISAADGATGQVTALLGLSVYVTDEKRTAALPTGEKNG